MVSMWTLRLLPLSNCYHVAGTWGNIAIFEPCNTKENKLFNIKFFLHWTWILCLKCIRKIVWTKYWHQRCNNYSAIIELWNSRPNLDQAECTLAPDAVLLLLLLCRWLSFIPSARSIHHLCSNGRWTQINKNKSSWTKSCQPYCNNLFTHFNYQVNYNKQYFILLLSLVPCNNVLLKSPL